MTRQVAEKVAEDENRFRFELAWSQDRFHLRTLRNAVSHVFYSSAFS